MSRDHTSRKDRTRRNRFRDLPFLSDQLALFRGLPFLSDQLAFFRGLTVEEQQTLLRALTAKVSRALFKNLSAREQIALISKEESREEKQAARTEVESAAWERAVLAEDCPSLQARLFWCLADGCLFEIKGAGKRRFKLQCGTVAVWTEGTWPLLESQVLEIVYGIEWQSLNEQKRTKLKARLRTLQSVLNDRFLKRKLPFRVTRPSGGGQLWLQILSKDGVQNKDRDRYEMNLPAAKLPTAPQTSLAECLDFVSKALAKRPQKKTDLERAWEKGSGRPGTLRRALKQLGAKHAKQGFGAGGEWYVSLPVYGKQSS